MEKVIEKKIDALNIEIEKCWKEMERIAKAKDFSLLEMQMKIFKEMQIKLNVLNDIQITLTILKTNAGN